MNEPQPKFASLPLPIIGAGSQIEEEPLAYLQLPQGMNTYRAPVLPEPEELRDHEAARSVLRELQSALTKAQRGETPERISLAGLPHQDRKLLGQLLGEGEVSAVSDTSPLLRVQEAIFAGVWRVIQIAADGHIDDYLEVAALPHVLRERAHSDGQRRGCELPTEAPPVGVMNAPAILQELRVHWSSDHPEQVINLTLLPLSAADVFWLDSNLGTGTVTILSRGYGNCRISSTQRPNTWRVTYYNSQDSVILDTIEVCTVPQVACAALQDLADSGTRLAELTVFLDEPSRDGPALDGT